MGNGCFSATRCSAVDGGCQSLVEDLSPGLLFVKGSSADGEYFTSSLGCVSALNAAFLLQLDAGLCGETSVTAAELETVNGVVLNGGGASRTAGAFYSAYLSDAASQGVQRCAESSWWRGGPSA
ncbi:hypothetical protein DQ04_01611160 [Trypanosoma grayi]|uniref:hypothetical protein n=1 Tax=Trypanosoma grayi TaxID=71804 RepID=UPI0004F3EFA9|nr:hypothetical protein DQ04_01611160 [Trypanosoma grayi]KEG12574.1 hypothetical protein DQ04_01611160 [Trypanosoma grayi]